MISLATPTCMLEHSNGGPNLLKEQYISSAREKVNGEGRAPTELEICEFCFVGGRSSTERHCRVYLDLIKSAESLR